MPRQRPAPTDRSAEGLRLISSRPAGAAWLLHGLWTTLDVDTALHKVLGGRRFTTDVKRVLVALVAGDRPGLEAGRR